MKHLDSDTKRIIFKVETKILHKFTDILVKEGFYWFLPVMVSKITDPLRSRVDESDVPDFVEFSIYNDRVTLTRSLILHKRILVSLGYEKIFFLSPNVRIEKIEKSRTNRHAYEFTQLDFEILYGKMNDVFKLVEKLIVSGLKYVKRDLKELGIKVRIPETPFKVYDREDLEKKYGSDWEDKISRESKDPVWVTNIPRQFYDYEGEDGRWRNYDLILPEGYGEVLSGGEREYEYEKILNKIKRSGLNPDKYKLFLDMAKDGLLKPSAGGGIGMERLFRWILKRDRIYDVQPFVRIPGEVSDL